jgi:hypothetical protein
MNHWSNFDLDASIVISFETGVCEFVGCEQYFPRYRAYPSCGIDEELSANVYRNA